MRTRRPGPPGRSRSPEDWIYGLNPVLEAVRSGRSVKALYISESRRLHVAGIEQEVLSRGISVRKADHAFFESRFPKGHQGIAAVVEPRTYAEMEDLLRIPGAKSQPALFLILDGIEDPRNFGAILRVADAGGVHGVVIQSHRAADLSAGAVKASAGAAEYVPVCMVNNIKYAIADMREQGIRILGAEASAGRSVWEADLTVPLGLVIGSEGKGMRRTVREDCDEVISLPMKGKVNSLNASVAAGIIIFEIYRQRA